MKTYTMIIIAMAAILSMMLFTACEKTTEPRNDFITVIPDSINISAVEADWNIGISTSSYSGDSKNTYGVEVDYLKDSTHHFGTDDKAYLIVNGNTMRLPLWHNASDGEQHDFGGLVTLNPGLIYTIGFKYNGQLKMSTTIRVPYNPVVTYPAAYSRTEPATIEWSQAEDNQYQRAGISSFYTGMNGGYPTIGYYTPEIDSTVRSVTLPAGCVAPSVGDTQTYYSMSVNEYSYRIVNRVMLSICTGDYKSYTLFNEGSVPNSVNYTDEDSDWVLAVYPVETDGGRAGMDVLARCLDSESLPLPWEEITFWIYGQSHVLHAVSDTDYMGTVDLNPGEQTNISLTQNGAYLLNNLNIYTPSVASLEYPATYNPSQELALAWTVPTQNYYQFLDVSSYFDDGTPEGEMSDYFRQLPGSRHSYTIPADAVQNYGPETDYTISLKQVNYTKEFHVAVIMIQENRHFYGTAPLQSKCKQITSMEKVMKQLGIKHIRGNVLVGKN